MSPTTLRRAVAGAPRVICFWVVFLAFELGCYIYAWVFIDLPGMVSPGYRKHRGRAAWNRLIGIWGRGVSRINRAINGVTIEVEGEVPDGRCIVVANHQSTADIPVLFEVLADKNLKFVVKKQLLNRIPAVSRALREGGFGVVDFTGPHRSVRDLISFSHSMSDWSGSPVIYPEGQRTMDGSIAPFRETGIRILVREAGLPVLPVVMDGLWKARTVLDFFSELPGARCRVRILRPIPASEAAADVEGLPRRLQALMSDELSRIRREPAAATA